MIMYYQYYNKLKHVNNDYSKYLNKKSISLINVFYKKDFELFNYLIINLNQRFK